MQHGSTPISVMGLNWDKLKSEFWNSILQGQEKTQQEKWVSRQWTVPISEKFEESVLSIATFFLCKNSLTPMQLYNSSISHALPSSSLRNQKNFTINSDISKNIFTFYECFMWKSKQVERYKEHTDLIFTFNVQVEWLVWSYFTKFTDSVHENINLLTFFFWCTYKCDLHGDILV